MYRWHTPEYIIDEHTALDLGGIGHEGSGDLAGRLHALVLHRGDVLKPYAKYTSSGWYAQTLDKIWIMAYPGDVLKP